MLGYPGAGKTTAATLLAQITGGVHLWADHERRAMFGQPTYTDAENKTLYDHMNEQAMVLLEQGKDVVFDTSFNHYSDRQNLRGIAEGVGATVELLWVTVDEATARTRATQNAHQQPTRALGDMSGEDFDRLRNKLEPPKPDEPCIELNGTTITEAYLRSRIGL